MRNALLLGALLGMSLASAQTASAQTEKSDPNYRRHYVGSSLFVLVNLIPLANPPHFYQLNYGYRVSPMDVVSLEAITWTYNAPLGIPYGPSYESADEAFPGKVQAYGVGAAYQRFLWKGIYATAHATPMRQIFFDSTGDRIGSGFQLFLTFRVGYHVELFGNRLFVEPSIAATSWPINTNLPESFRQKEAKWPSYFLVEPGLHFGVKL